MKIRDDVLNNPKQSASDAHSQASGTPGGYSVNGVGMSIAGSMVIASTPQLYTGLSNNKWELTADYLNSSYLTEQLLSDNVITVKLPGLTTQNGVRQYTNVVIEFYNEPTGRIAQGIRELAQRISGTGFNLHVEMTDQRQATNQKFSIENSRVCAIDYGVVETPGMYSSPMTVVVEIEYEFAYIDGYPI